MGIYVLRGKKAKCTHRSGLENVFSPYFLLAGEKKTQTHVR